MQKLIFGIIALTWFFACTNSENESTKKNSLNSIKVDINNNNKKISNFSEIIDSYQFIKLQSKNAPLIGDIKKIFCNENQIFIQDALSNKVVLFDTLGNYVRTFGSIGESPSEYRSLDDFVVDKQHNHILLLDGNSKKVVVYDINGSFVNYHSLGYFSFRFEKIADNFVFVTGGDTKENLYITDSNFKIMSQIRPKSVKTRMLMLRHFSLLNKNKVLYSESLTDTIFVLTGTQLAPYLYLDLGERSIGKLSDKEIEDKYFKENRILFDKIMENYQASPDMLVINDDFLGFMTGKQSSSYYVLYDLSANDYRIITKDTKDDISFTAYPIIFQTAHTDKFVGVIHSYLLNNVNFKNFVPKTDQKGQERYARIKSLASDITDSSNPILIVAKLKIKK